MSAVPHIGQTRRNRRDLRLLSGATAYAEHQHYTDETARWEMERAARTELLPTEATVFAAGQTCCAASEDDEPKPALREDFVISVLAVAALCLVAVATTWGLPA